MCKQSFAFIVAAMMVSAVPVRAQIEPNQQAIADVGAGKIKEAKASWWGFDPEDATQSLQAAINSGVPKLTVDDVGQPWIVTPITLVSDQEILFEEGVEVGEEVEGEEGAESEEGMEEELSVAPSPPVTQPSATVGRNEDINLAEQIFLSILQAVPNHANARYSLAVLYQKVGEKENQNIMADSLLNILTDQETKDVVRQQFGR